MKNNKKTVAHCETLAYIKGMDKEPKDKRIDLRVSTSMREKLEEIAEEERRKFSDFCRIVLEDYAKKYREGKE